MPPAEPPGCAAGRFCCVASQPSPLSSRAFLPAKARRAGAAPQPKGLAAVGRLVRAELPRPPRERDKARRQGWERHAVPMPPMGGAIRPQRQHRLHRVRQQASQQPTRAQNLPGHAPRAPVWGGIAGDGRRNLSAEFPGRAGAGRQCDVYGSPRTGGGGATLGLHLGSLCPQVGLHPGRPCPQVWLHRPQVG